MPVYAVAKGRIRGVYSNWDDCKANVNSYRNARYKKFNTVAEANAFIDENLNSKGSITNSKSESVAGAAWSPYSRPLNSTSRNYLKNTTSVSVIPSPPIEDFVSGPAYRSLVLVSHPPAIYSTDTLSHCQDTGKPVYTSRIRTVYVDGASRGNGSANRPASGYGVFYGENDPRNAAVPISNTPYASVKPTNQRAELLAIKHAMADIANDLSKGITDSYAIYSDSQYAQKCITEWAPKWQTSGWKNSKNDPVANRDIIEPMLPTVAFINKKYKEFGQGELSFHHVKGHNGDPGNEEADRLANIGADMDKK